MRHLLPFLVTPLWAGELTVKPSPFRIEHQFDATILPNKHLSLTLEPESWKSFTIETLADHGSAVKKGDVLVAFEREAYDRQLVDQTRAVATAALNLATEELNLAKLKEEVALQIQAAQQAKKAADEDLAYFHKTGRPAAEKEIEQSLKMAQFRLSSAQEELKQLKQMYDADDLTEETEEIILERQKFAVEASEFSLAEAKREAASKRTYGLPRQELRLKQAATEASIALAKAQANLPRSIEVANLALQGSREALNRQQLELERLKKDGALLSWTAPADGVFLHGSLEDRKWMLGDLAKVLKVGGSVPLDRSILSLAPADATASLTAWVEPKIARSLAPKTPVSLQLPGHEEIALGGTVATVSSSLGLDGKQFVTLNGALPKELPSLWTSPVKCQAVAYQNAAVLQVPAAATQLGSDGSWTVEVKLADGKTERRKVTRGRISGKNTEILKGLEPGQVVVTPGE